MPTKDLDIPYKLKKIKIGSQNQYIFQKSENLAPL